ncbi:MAG TPA: phosphoglucosamine mutase [Pyrinomonadaceae bacterium]|jgi:phosphomannomutase|nr:phosphoglucosamine mutase [Pyrinomonadaceae bacterium]
MKPLKIGITGVRGIVGETFTPEVAVGFSQAFGTYLDGGRILVCRDTRASGPMVRAAVIAGLLAAGCEVIDLGVSPTPSLQLAIPWLNAEGGIAITAGHNPAQWNALKFVRADGLYLNPTQAEELLDIFHQGEFTKATWDAIHPAVKQQDPIAHHIERLNSAFDVEAIRRRRLKVAVDCCNGACARLIPRWLAEIGCEVLAINDNPAAAFPHHPEPKPETMAQLAAVVKAARADIGFAHDADGERLGIVTESAEALSEELTLAIATRIRLVQRTGTVVTNISSTGGIDQIAARYGGSVLRTPVGQTYISEAMIESNAVLGGEGSGGVTVPELHATHDSAAAVGLILEGLARNGQSISELVQDLPHLTMLKHNVEVDPNRLYSVLQNFRTAIEREQLTYDLTDGIKLVLTGGWIHVRASNTESMIRVIAEAENSAGAHELIAWVRDRLSS